MTCNASADINYQAHCDLESISKDNTSRLKQICPKKYNLRNFSHSAGQFRVVWALAIAITMIIASVQQVSAQVVQGVIHYELTIDMHRTLPANRPELRNFIPQYRTDHFSLYFNSDATAYKPRQVQTQEATGGGGARVVMRAPRVETHIERSSRARTVSLDFMGRNILIVDTMGIEPWRFGSETMQIAGYTVMMAWTKDTVNNVEITAWFSPQLPPLQGPDRFVTLPGTVLAVDINNGERVWVARSIEGREVTSEELAISRPNRAEVMTREQFNAFLEAQMQRMNQNNPGSGAMLRSFIF